MKDFGAPSEDAELVRRAHADLEELFLLVIVGEFNAGKSAFINALVGSKVLPEGVTPTTAQINVHQYGETVERLGVLVQEVPHHDGQVNASTEDIVVVLVHALPPSTR